MSPFVSADQLCNAFGAAKSTGYQKSKQIRDMFRMSQFDTDWCLPSMVEKNPLVWMIEVDGFTVDASWLPRELQEIAFEKGLIPYVPDEKVEIDSIEVVDDIVLNDEELSAERNKKKRRRKSEDPS